VAAGDVLVVGERGEFENVCAPEYSDERLTDGQIG
jgi:hypothetical protein